MKGFLTIVAALMAVPALGHGDHQGAEYQLAACIHEKDPALLVEIRDASSQEAFVEALRRGAVLCEMSDLDGFSMGKFFDAIAELIGKPTYEDSE